MTPETKGDPRAYWPLLRFGTEEDDDPIERLDDATRAISLSDGEMFLLKAVLRAYCAVFPVDAKYERAVEGIRQKVETACDVAFMEGRFAVEAVATEESTDAKSCG